MKICRTLLLPIFFSWACSSHQDPDNKPYVYQKITAQAGIEGKSEYIASPFVTAGDRVYMIGHQDGSFPDLGWHVSGEMAGIWNHPIKLMDGFDATLQLASGETFCLNKADQFVNYPMANRHHFTWTGQSFEVDRTQFVPDNTEGMLIEFRITNKSDENKTITFSFTGQSDLRPTWLGERTNMTDAEDEFTFDENLGAAKAKDKNNPWFVMFGSNSTPQGYSNKNAECTVQPKGSGKSATLIYQVNVAARSEVTIPVFIAGSYHSEEAMYATYSKLQNKGNELLEAKSNRYQAIRNTAKVSLPDKSVEEMYEWLKYNVDWLKRNVPEQGIGLTAGLPDYPWWFGADAAYSLQGVLATGNHELAKNTIRLLHKISQRTNKNGRIIHEVSTNGSVYNPGNVNETPQFVTLVAQYFAWTGDTALVRELYPDLKKGLAWVLDERDPDHNHYPNGSGMMEIPGLESELEMIDVASYTQQALESGAILARTVGDNATAIQYQNLADELKTSINRDWWIEAENSFGDFRGTAKEALEIVDAALIRSDSLGKAWAAAELNQTKRRLKSYPVSQIKPHVVYHNWVVNTPLETGVADAAKAKAALQQAKLYENPFGLYVTGIDRTDEPDSVVLKSRKKTFSYTGAVMTLPTGVLAVSAAKYGHPDAALGYIVKLSRSFSYALPGSMYEVSPDFGMITQAWNIYGVAVPIVNHFFGIQPAANEKRIFISPNLPKQWNSAEIKNVKAGDNEFSLAISLKPPMKEYRIEQTRPDWQTIVDVSNAKKILINNQPVDLKTIVDHSVTVTGSNNVIQIHF